MCLRRIAFAAIPIALALANGACSTLGLGGDETLGDGAQAPKVEVELSGLDAAQERNARAYLGLAEEPCDAPEWRVRQRFAAAAQDIARGLRALGHYRPEVEKQLSRGETCWQARFEVEPGPRVTLAHVEIVIEGDAAEDAEVRRLLGELPLRAGEPLDHGTYTAAKGKLASLASERGYHQARLTVSELAVDPDAGTAVARLRLESGPRYRLGEATIAVEGLDEDLVRRIMEYEPGQPYSAERLHQINQVLSDSGYFANVDVRADPERADDLTVPVIVTATTRKRHLYTAGVGYATDTGPRVRLGYENRRINRRGHRFSASLRAAIVESVAQAEYRIPLEHPRAEWLTFSAAVLNEDTKSYETVAGNLGVGTTHLRGRWLETRFLELRRDDFDIADTDGTSTFLTPGVSWARTQTDGSLRPSRGWRLYGEVRGGAEAMLSSANVLRARIAAGWVHGFSWKGRIITRAEAGALFTDDFAALPPYLRFFTGGDNSIRGYRFDAVGATDDADQVIGGHYLGVASVEYEHPIQGPWSAAVFIDSGNAFDQDFDQRPVTGVGAGIRWLSPVGPIRLDLAHPLDDDDTVVRLHLRIGPDL